MDEIKIDNKRETIKESDMQCNNALCNMQVITDDDTTSKKEHVSSS